MTPELETHLRSLVNFPSPAGVATHIIQLAQDRNIEMGKVAKAIGMDPALATKVLRLDNFPVPKFQLTDDAFIEAAIASSDKRRGDQHMAADYVVACQKMHDALAVLIAELTGKTVAELERTAFDAAVGWPSTIRNVWEERKRFARRLARRGGGPSGASAISLHDDQDYFGPRGDDAR